MALGSGLTTLMNAPWQLVALWGLAVGLGTGAMALVLGAIVANRWFVRHRGLVTGLFSAASATGQLIFLPLIAYLAVHLGWRWSAGLVAGAALLLVPLVLLFLADRPSDVGTTAYGADGTEPPDPVRSQVSPGRLALRTLRLSSRSGTFWVLAATFFICGWSTNGLIGTHFVPGGARPRHARDDGGEPAGADRGLRHRRHRGLGLVHRPGRPALLLVMYYALRGLSLLVVPALLGPSVHPNLFLFIVFYGLDWVATVPPTIALCRTHFGSNAAASCSAGSMPRT